MKTVSGTKHLCFIGGPGSVTLCEFVPGDENLDDFPYLYQRELHG